jgi:hypothetical protein
MITFWEMSAEERRALLVPEHPGPYGTKAMALARLWAGCGEDEILMRIKYADEIEEIQRTAGMIIQKVTVTAKRRQLNAKWTMEKAQDLT